MTNSVFRSSASNMVIRALGGLVYDWVMVVFILPFVGGLFLDGWAHNHGRVDNTFFTPWHGFFYGGYALVMLCLLATLTINRLRHYPWRRVLPNGYALSLVGGIIFAIGGLGDLIWHEIFGIEESFEALLSPTHLILVLGLALIAGGPLRAAWQRAGRRPSWRTLGPALLSLTALVSTLTFITMYAHPIVFGIAGAKHYEFNGETGQVAGVLGMVVTASILIGSTLLVLRRWTLPAGSLTLVWGLNLTAMTALNYQQIDTLYQYLIMMGAILLIDMLRIRLQPSLRNQGGWRVFAFIAPLLYNGAYIIAVLLTEGSLWSVHMLTGSVVLCGVAGWLISYLLLPPRMPVESGRYLS